MLSRNIFMECNHAEKFMPWWLIAAQRALFSLVYAGYKVIIGTDKTKRKLSDVPVQIRQM